MSSFATPAAPSGGIKWADLKGRLLVIEPLAHEVGIVTAFGDADAVRANVYAIDGQVEEYVDTLVFPKVLASQLKSQIGQKVLGRLGQGSQQKAGQSPPWILQDPTPEDIAAGEQWLANRTSSSFAAPSSGGADPAPPF